MATQSATLSLSNSQAALQQRRAQGRLTWSGPMIVLVARSVLALCVQGALALLFALQGNPTPMLVAGTWYTVYGTVIDVGTLVLLIWWTHREGLRLLDLIGLDKHKLVTDVLLGVGIFAGVFPLVMGGAAVGVSLLLYGTPQPDFPAGTFIRSLPLWGVLYSRLIWWVIWSFTEEITYQGYVLPRLQTLTGHTWVAMLLVTLGWGIQHAFLPLFFDGQRLLFTFLIFVPLAVVMQLLYLRLRRLPPLIVAHWGMDFVLTLMTIA